VINKVSARSLTLLIFTIGWAVCGQPQHRHESMTLSVSVKCLIQWNSFLCQKTS